VQRVRDGRGRQRACDGVHAVEGPGQDEVVVCRERRERRREGAVVDQPAGFIDYQEDVKGPAAVSVYGARPRVRVGVEARGLGIGGTYIVELGRAAGWNKEVGWCRGALCQAPQQDGLC
jgi:hypothetical protein